jgi:rhodanese-related sulfurtransferase
LDTTVTQATLKEKIMRLRISFLTLLVAALVSERLRCIASACALPAAAVAAAVAPAAVANPDALVDTAWVAAHLDDPNVRLLALHGKQEDFDAGHLPGAIYVNLGADLTNPDDPTEGQILTQEALSALFSRLGIENDDTVVVYDANNNLQAARAYWALKYYQHADVRLYDGGLKQWTAAGNAPSTEPAVAAGRHHLRGEATPTLTCAPPASMCWSTWTTRPPSSAMRAGRASMPAPMCAQRAAATSPARSMWTGCRPSTRRAACSATSPI